LRLPRGTFNLQKVALTSPTRGGIFRSRTQAPEFFFPYFLSTNSCTIETYLLIQTNNNLLSFHANPYRILSGINGRCTLRLSSILYISLRIAAVPYFVLCTLFHHLSVCRRFSSYNHLMLPKLRGIFSNHFTLSYL
jgi:hypothetical protein